MERTAQVALEILRGIANESKSKDRSLMFHAMANALEQEIIRLEKGDITELLAAADALIRRWDYPNWSDAKHTGEYIARLRIAVEKVRETERPCTCHPDDNPPNPCAKKYALGECRATHSL